MMRVVNDEMSVAWVGLIFFARAYSSAGWSARLISVRSVVQVHLGPPNRDGGVAQLGERLLRMQEVIGSIPIISTILWVGIRVLCEEDGFQDASL